MVRVFSLTTESFGAPRFTCGSASSYPGTCTKPYATTEVSSGFATANGMIWLLAPMVTRTRLPAVTWALFP